MLLTPTNLKIISVLEAIYVIYFLCFFKTRMSLDKGTILKKLGLGGKYIDHPTYYAKTPISMICPFGHDMAYVIAVYFIIRFFLPLEPKVIYIFNLVVATLIFIGSWLNMNAVVYLAPIVLLELSINSYLLIRNQKMIK